MAIKTGFGVGWLDRAMGYELKSISKSTKPNSQTADSFSNPVPNLDQQLSSNDQ
jgi:hypothetical protein